MQIKQKIRFLTVIWGERYIKEFLDISAPSYLAKGNIPAISECSDFEVYILTSEESVHFFESSEVFLKIRKICPVKFIFIDDLIASGCYGVTLTLAYARGVAYMGDKQTETYFIFMNSDFVLADGSLRSLFSHFEQGYPCIMSASLRGCSEALLPLLQSRINKTDFDLSISPRELVKLTLGHLHPTVTTKISNQTVMRCTTNTQIYWRINEDTLLARNYLIFMLAIKPEVPLETVNSYSDYGFVPEMVPSGKMYVIGDSDDFYMLEMQRTQQESNLLEWGTFTPEKRAEELSIWTTKEHRLFAQYDTIFHSSEIPSDIEIYKIKADELVKSIDEYLKPPVDHVFHHYWVNGLYAWWERRTVDVQDAPSYGVALSEALAAKAEGKGLPYQFPEELVLPLPFQGNLDLAPSQTSFGLRVALRAWLSFRKQRGEFPDVSLFSASWEDAQMLHRWVSLAKKDSAEIVLIDLGNGSMGKIFASRQGIGVASLSYLSDPSMRENERVLIYFPIPYLLDSTDTVKGIMTQISEIQCKIASYICKSGRGSSVSVAFYNEIGNENLQNIMSIDGKWIPLKMIGDTSGFEVSATFTRAKWVLISERIVEKCKELFWRSSFFKKIALSFVLGAAITFIFIRNFCSHLMHIIYPQRSLAVKEHGDFISSVLFTFKK